MEDTFYELNIKYIEQAIKYALEYSHEFSAIEFTFRNCARPNLYVGFVTTANSGELKLFAEGGKFISSNPDDDFKIDKDKLKERGWKGVFGIEDLSKIQNAIDSDYIRIIAVDLYQTLIEVYGQDPNDPIQINNAHKPYYFNLYFRLLINKLVYFIERIMDWIHRPKPKLQIFMQQALEELRKSKDKKNSFVDKKKHGTTRNN